MLNSEIVLVHAGGHAFGGWERVQVSASIKEACRTFRLETTEHPSEFKFPPGTPIKITSNGDLLVDGYVNQYEPSGDAASHKICITGRSSSQDAIDSAADTETGEWDDADPGRVAADLASPYDVDIRARVPLDPVDKWAIQPGETVHRNVARMIRPQGVTMMGNADGTVDITNASVAEYHYGILMEGWNIKAYSGVLSDQNRFSTYVVRGQRRLGSSDADMHVEERAKDAGGNRRRTRIIINETDTDPKRARERARHERDRSAGLSVSCSITTQGFRDFAGKVFAPNHIIYVHSPVLLHITQSMLIESIVLTQDARSGSESEIALVDPRAYRGKGGSGTGDTDAAWVKGYD